ncbi:Hypothetical predicted protein, partial [Podarcis lilfordi]
VTSDTYLTIYSPGQHAAPSPESLSRPSLKKPRPGCWQEFLINVPGLEGVEWHRQRLASFLGIDYHPRRCGLAGAKIPSEKRMQPQLTELQDEEKWMGRDILGQRGQACRLPESRPEKVLKGKPCDYYSERWLVKWRGCLSSQRQSL